MPKMSGVFDHGLDSVDGLNVATRLSSPSASGVFCCTAISEVPQQLVFSQIVAAATVRICIVKVCVSVLKLQKMPRRFAYSRSDSFLGGKQK